MNKNVLITLWFADGFHGGVKYSAELGNHLHSLGYTVYLCGVVTTDEMVDFFAQYNVRLYNIKNFPTDINFDLVWAHHWPIMPYLIRKDIKYRRLVNSSISQFLLLERLLWFHENVDMCITLGRQQKQLYITKYGVPADKIEVLPNMAPDEFFEYNYSSHAILRSIAIVTNHPPREILDSVKKLKRRGFNVVIYGDCKGGRPVNITPEVLAKHDVIITIGKTVQYSLAMGIPVYNYDVFGGSGYITPQNIDEEELHNFSGRSHRTKKSAAQIVDEIINNYEMAHKLSQQLKVIAKERYSLSAKINNILKRLKSKKPVKHIIENNTNRFLFDYCEMVVCNGTAHKSKYSKKTNESSLGRLWRHIRTRKI